MVKKGRWYFEVSLSLHQVNINLRKQDLIIVQLDLYVKDCTDIK